MIVFPPILGLQSKDLAVFQSGLEVNDLYSSPFKSDHGPVMIQPLDLAMTEYSVIDRVSLPEPAQQLFQLCRPGCFPGYRFGLLNRLCIHLVKQPVEKPAVSVCIFPQLWDWHSIDHAVFFCTIAAGITGRAHIAISVIEIDDCLSAAGPVAAACCPVFGIVHPSMSAHVLPSFETTFIIQV